MSEAATLYKLILQHDTAHPDALHFLGVLACDVGNLPADSPEAAKMLSHDADDLRRSLEARDVNLLSLDVSTSSEQQRQAAAGAGANGFGESDRSNGSRRNGSNGDPEVASAPAAAETTLVLPNGVLCDVLA